MKSVLYLIKRNTKLFFKDKGMFLTSLVTPLILLVLYSTFLSNIYRESFESGLGDVIFPDKLINGTVAAQLFSSLLAVSCVTVAFCSNMVMVQDKVTGARADLTIAPTKGWMLSLGYYISTLIVTSIICFAACGICFIYLGFAGWYFSITDVLLILFDVFLLSMFGTALSSIINHFLSTQGQMSAVGTVISAGYGFICGAYMPIASFNSGLQKVLSFLPGTYATSLIRNHCFGGVFREMDSLGTPDTVLAQIKDSIDCNVYFFGNQVSVAGQYGILIAFIALLVCVYVLLNVFKRKRKN